MSTRLTVVIVSVLFMIITQGCASVKERTHVPGEVDGMARIPGIPDARMWGNEPPVRLGKEWLSRSQAELEERYAGIMRQEHHYLAISGGGQRGAFGAGLLVGWSEAGTRPEFTLVTGVSTGALAAPLVYLGPAYDNLLRELYTSYSTEDLVRRRNIIAFLTGDSAVSTKRFRALIAKYYNQELMDAIAAEYRRGRILFIGTTDIDAGRPVIWNIGRIAASGAPGALELIRKVILASASIPVAFPPVFIEVEADGRRYEEMHVDGGTASQVFLYPAGVNWGRIIERLQVIGRPRVYLIRNARLEPEREVVEARVLPIASRSISSLIRTQGIGDMFRIYLSAKRDGLDYNLAYIPKGFEGNPEEVFDREYMGKLFDLGYEMAKSGFPWAVFPSLAKRG